MLGHHLPCATPNLLFSVENYRTSTHEKPVGSLKDPDPSRVFSVIKVVFASPTARSVSWRGRFGFNPPANNSSSSIRGEAASSTSSTRGKPNPLDGIRARLVRIVSSSVLQVPPLASNSAWNASSIPRTTSALGRFCGRASQHLDNIGASATGIGRPAAPPRHCSPLIRLLEVVGGRNGSTGSVSRSIRYSLQYRVAGAAAASPQFGLRATDRGF